MDLEAGVDALFVEEVENRTPALRELVERGLDQPGRPLRKRIEVGPRQRAGEWGVLGDAEAARRARRELELLHCPRRARGRFAADLGRREAVDCRVDRKRVA